MITSFPYPGLRPFRREEIDIFFGREEQVDQLLGKLEHSRFLAVVGSSGCGKSSLVRAGMIGALETGFMASAGVHWRVAEMRPGNRPLRNLAEALLTESALKHERGGDVDAAAFLHADLRRGPLGLVEVLSETPLPERTNLLVLVDQFEEIFRYRQEGSSDEADAFVALLLATAAQREVPVYVVITMRSDYLGDCALFYGLPEAINESQFLTPRLTREQQRDAILGPAAVFGGTVEPALVNRLLNDMGPDPDQLPLMQHVLMRMWPRTSDDTEAVNLTLEHYTKVGGLAEALSRHADKAFKELDKEQQHIAEVLFRCLSERGADQRDTRRPVEMKAVAEVAEVSVEDVVKVVEVFRRPGRNFITPPVGTALYPDTFLDISHESLIRQWDRLNRWVEQESASAETYRRLEQTACLWKTGQAALWITPDLENALKWREDEKPIPAWAERYGNHFEIAMEFLDASEQKSEEERQRREEERQRELAQARALAEEQQRRAEAERQRAEEQVSATRRLRWLAAALAVAVLLILGASVVAFLQLQEALAAKVEAVKAREAEEEQRLFAESQAIAAESERKKAEEAKKKEEEHRKIAENQAIVAENERKKAEEAKEKEEAQRKIAENQAIVAENERKKAEEAKEKEEAQRKIARSQAIVADSERKKAEEAKKREGEHRRIAQEKARLATSSKLAMVAVDNLDTDPELSILLALEAVSTRVTREAEDALRKAVQTSRVRFTLGHSAEVEGVAFSPDGKHIATASSDGTARVWDAATGHPVVTLKGHAAKVTCVAFSPDGTRIATASFDGTAKVWDAASVGQALLTLKGHTNRINAIAFSPDGSRIATASVDGTARIWEWEAMSEGAVLLTLVGHTAEVTDIAFSPPDGTLIATASFDGTAKIWDAASGGQALLTLEGHNNRVNAITFSPDGDRIATASNDGTAKVWDATTGQALLTLKRHTDWVTDIAFSPNGTCIATASLDKTAKLCNAEFGQTLLTLKGHTDWVTGIAFNQDGTRVATSSVDGTARVWEVAIDQDEKLGPDIGELVELANERVTRELTAEERRKFLLGLDNPTTPGASSVWQGEGIR